MISEDQMKEYDDALKQAELTAREQRVNQMQQDLVNTNQERGMITEQLSLGEELTRIDYLLRGYTIKVNENTGESIWTKPDDNSMVILSEYGVHLVRNTIAWYLNKNTLLSNYTEETILQKMEDFSSSLNDDIFMEYDKVFQFPTFEDCKKILEGRIQHKINIKKFANELVGKEETDKSIKDKFMKEIEGRVEVEFQKIREQLMKNKLKRFELLMRCIQDAVHSTYNRAWKGQERTTLRQHIHISETNGGKTMMQDGRGANPLSWFGKR